MLQFGSESNETKTRFSEASAEGCSCLSGKPLMGAPVWPACMIATAHAYHFPLPVLQGIHSVEGGKVGTVALNKNGTADLGLMQVNTSWLPVLSYATGLSPSVLRSRLTNDACFSIAMAGSILDLYRQETHGDVWKAVGFYHSHTTPLSLGYQAQVLTASISDMLKQMKEE